MKKLMVELGDRRYPIYIGEGLYARLPAWLQEQGIDPRRKLMIITDSKVAPLYAHQVAEPLRLAGFEVGISSFPAGEESKNLAQLEQLIGECLRFGLDRKSVILALGGGVVGDLAGFVAATFMRGIPFVQLPTTLLAHDSSVGGKVGVNHALGKNYIGAFHQPLMVVFDVSTIQTLPAREIRSGLAEVVKHALIRDASFAEWLENHVSRLTRLHSDALSEAILRGCEIKAEVVAKDEREQGLRAILNYGHTIGHALEAVTRYERYTHGEAVAIGMAGEARLSRLVLGAQEEVIRRTESLIEAFGLPIRTSIRFDEGELLQAMKRDKKAEAGTYTFVLAEAIGKVRVVRNVEEQAVRQALREIQL